MSNMDLARLDADGSGAPGLTLPRASSHHHAFHALQRAQHQVEHADSDDEAEEDEALRISLENADAPHQQQQEDGTLSHWLSSASSFFMGAPDASSSLARPRSSSAVTTPLSGSEPSSPPSPAPVDAARRSAQQMSASFSGRPASLPPLPTGVQERRALSQHGSPRVASDRDRLKVTRFASNATPTQLASDPILRAASNGLPRTLSQLELISDVTTMP